MKELIGQNLFIRTVTYHYTGMLDCISDDGKLIKLTTAAWIADSGRFHDALLSNDFDEVEPYVNPVWIAVDAIVDITTIDTLPTKQK